MKRIICLLLCAALLMVCACQPRQEVPSAPEVQQKDWNQEPNGRTLTVPLYFVTQDKARLSSELREINLESGQLLAEAIVQALLEGPRESGLVTVLSGAKLNFIEVSGNVANIDLSGEFSYGQGIGLDESDTIRARAMLANTLTETLDVDYVNLYVEGREQGYVSVPLGSMGRLSSDLALYVEQTKKKIDDNEYPMQRVVTLYFPDKSGEYLLCEARDIQIADSDSANQILEELLKGPTDTENMQAFGSRLTGRVTYPAMEYDEDAGMQTTLNRMQVRLRGQLSVDEELVSAAVTCTMMGFLPRTYGVYVISDDGVIPFYGEDTFKGHSEYAAKIGTLATLYYPAEEGSALKAVRRAVAQGDAEDPQVLLRELMQQAPEGCRQVYPDSVSESDLLSVRLSERTAIVDLSRSWQQACQNMSEEETFLMVYSIINTLTTLPEVHQVQFLVEGAAVRQLGSIMLHSPLLNNPGLIAE